MASFFYSCRECNHKFGQEIPEGQDTRQPCPICNSVCNWVRRGSAAIPAALEGAEYESSALGVHPNQVAEMQRMFPHHRFAKNGNMIIKGQREKNRVLRDLGYVEYTPKDLKYRD